MAGYPRYPKKYLGVPVRPNKMYPMNVYEVPVQEWWDIREPCHVWPSPTKTIPYSGQETVHLDIMEVYPESCPRVVGYPRNMARGHWATKTMGKRHVAQTASPHCPALAQALPSEIKTWGMLIAMSTAIVQRRGYSAQVSIEIYLTRKWFWKPRVNPKLPC